MCIRDRFHTFGAPSRIKNPEDRAWVEAVSGQQIGRLVTVAYMAMLRISTKPVSYTHLDVYKRQCMGRSFSSFVAGVFRQ